MNRRLIAVEEHLRLTPNTAASISPPRMPTPIGNPILIKLIVPTRSGRPEILFMSASLQTIAVLINCEHEDREQDKSHTSHHKQLDPINMPHRLFVRPATIPRAFAYRTSVRLTGKRPSLRRGTLSVPAVSGLLKISS